MLVFVVVVPAVSALAPAGSYRPHRRRHGELKRVISLQQGARGRAQPPQLEQKRRGAH